MRYVLLAMLVMTPTAAGADKSALDIFNQRILPIFQAKDPSSCTECHLSSVDLKDYIHPDQEKTFASLAKSGLIDVDHPDESKILKFIARKPETPNLIANKIRQMEYEAFRAWITAAVNDPELLKVKPDGTILGPSVPVEVIQHAWLQWMGQSVERTNHHVMAMIEEMVRQGVRGDGDRQRHCSNLPLRAATKRGSWDSTRRIYTRRACR